MKPQSSFFVSTHVLGFQIIYGSEFFGLQFWNQDNFLILLKSFMKSKSSFFESTHVLGFKKIYGSEFFSLHFWNQDNFLILLKLFIMLQSSFFVSTGGLGVGGGGEIPSGGREIP